ncbi:MAG: protein translocase subunit SecF [Proteobacteria bacterium]|nr:protein translocase subunit SecF [Pseudomonadota bacterium]
METQRKFNLNYFSIIKITASISIILFLIGLYSILMMFSGKNVGIDFHGGNAITVSFKKNLTINEIRDLAGKTGINFDIAHFPSENKAILKTKVVELNGKKVSDILESSFQQSVGKDGFSIEGITEIGPRVGSELKKDATIAFILSAIGIIFYLAWRFEKKFGIAAAIATYHDVIAIVGIMYLLKFEMDLIVLTALLTVAGYSLTDTVVVFDRIRENLRKKGVANIKDTINNSINEVMSRTIITSLTTLFSSVALLIFGGEVLRSFALAITLGVIIGTYSSIFIASPLLVLFKIDPKRLKK